MILELHCQADYVCTDCRAHAGQIGWIDHRNCPRLRGPDGTLDPLPNDEFLVTASIRSGIPRGGWWLMSARVAFTDYYRLRIHPPS